VADFDPQQPAIHNDMALSSVDVASTDTLDDNSTILIDSKLFRTHQLSRFPGKCRCFGSAALHICLVAQQTGFVLAHSGPVHIWDIAAAHAIARRVGLTVQYMDGQPLTYKALLSGQRTPAHVVAGAAALLATICPMIVPLPGASQV
jgi:myo-inositol-1(or 4)-monophosphatase